jgi:protocatechuate 3,4-dioxygenase beta subunit
MMSTIGLLVALSFSQAAVPAAAGRVSGRVAAEGANTPIAGARIMLFPAGRPTGPIGMPPQTLTDQDGRYVFEQVAAGNYRVQVQKAGFAPVSDPTQLPPMITVAAGQSLDNVDFRLQKGGAITGRVLDANGDPLPDARIMAMRRGPSSAPGARLLPAPMQGMQQTNDLGEYRVSGLASGEYFIAAAPRGMSPFGGPGVSPAPAGTARMTAAMTFYPGTTDQVAAQVIVVAPGAEVGNIVFTMQTAPAFSVSGIVVDESGSPVAHAVVMLMGVPRSGMLGPAGSAQSQDDGRFVIGEVTAGTYRVNASMMIIGGTGRSSVGSGGSSVGVSSGVSGSGGSSVGVSSGVSGSGGGGGFVTFSAGAPSDPAAEVLVTDADVNNVRVVARRPNP